MYRWNNKYSNDLSPISESSGNTYGAIRALLSSKGKPIGNNDLWIAAHAKAAALTLVTNNAKAYKLTASFPREERYGLSSQIRRSAVSIPSNIAEGYGRKTTADYIRMLYIAYGSTCELETQVLLAGDLGFIDKVDLSVSIEDINEVERMLMALIKTLEQKHLVP